MDPALRAKLESIAERHEELGEMLCAPEIAQDKTRLLALSREHAEIAPLAAAIARFRELELRLAEGEELLNDPDLRDMAESDLHELRRQQVTLEAELQKLLLPQDPNDSRDV